MYEENFHLTSKLNPYKQGEPSLNVFDAVIIGAGFSGMYMLYRLLKLKLNVIVLEEASDVGGTWYWNRYPGAQCDGESIEYSYSFSEELEQEWEWTHRYSTQPQILEYANHVADRFNLRKHINFNTRVTSAQYNDKLKNWKIKANTDTYIAHYCIMATGSISSPNKPNFKGLDSFQGQWYLTGRWPKNEVDFIGKRVGIIGTGSSAVQAIPVIAQQAKHLTVFQRTANYSLPAHNRLLGKEEIKSVKANYSTIRAKARNNRGGAAGTVVGNKSALEVTAKEREGAFEIQWNEGGLGITSVFNDILADKKANITAANFVKSKIHQMVGDPITAELLSPKNIIGCKRVCVDTDYYITYNRNNVDLIDINVDPIETIIPNGIKTSHNIFDLDIIVFAIGYDALTGALLAIDIRGKDNKSLKEKWTHGPRTYLGLSSEGFPNMFTITGPGSPSVLTNMMTSIEQHVDWIAECIKFLNQSGKMEFEASIEAENKWVQHVEEIAQGTLRYSCNSWYLGSNVPGKPRVFIPYAGGVPTYAEKCYTIAQNGYQGFVIT